MQLTINGQAYPIEGQLSVASLVERLKLDVRKIAIERNRKIISRSAYDTTQVQHGDVIEIVGFIGGG